MSAAHPEELVARGRVGQRYVYALDEAPPRRLVYLARPVRRTDDEHEVVGAGRAAVQLRRGGERRKTGLVGAAPPHPPASSPPIIVPARGTPS